MKSKFIKSTFILMIGGLLTKIFSMFIKIILTRNIGTKGVSLYMLVLPTFNLFITLCTLSLPVAISKLVAENKRSKKIILSIIPPSIIYNFILMILLIILSPFISNYLLRNEMVKYPIMAISFTLPIICLSGILKGYFFGHQKMGPYVLENVCEQIIRLLFIIIFIPIIIKKSLIMAITSLVLINIVSESMAIIVMLFFIPNKKINISDFKMDKNINKDILNISVPTTGSRLIGSISYFLEPILVTYFLSKNGYSFDYITLKYGVITGYVYPLLLLPSFFTMAISTSLLPVITNYFANRKYDMVNKRLRESIYLSLLVGIISTFVFMLIPGILLKFLYNTNLGINYIKIIAPFFLLHYIQGPLTTYLTAINKANIAMRGTLIGSIIKNITLILLALFKTGIWSLIIATLVNIIYVTIQHLYFTIKYSKSF